LRIKNLNSIPQKPDEGKTQPMKTTGGSFFDRERKRISKTGFEYGKRDNKKFPCRLMSKPGLSVV
jgi:hypothetical protein